MSISGIGSSNYDLMQQQIQSFRSGKTNIQKEEIEEIQSSLGETQGAVADGFASLLESFDQIDTNGDGISFEELDGFMKGSDSPPPPPPPPGSEIFDKLRSGEGVTKEDLESALSEMEADGQEIPGHFSDLLSSFDSIDTNKDGQITEDEMQAKMEAEKNDFEMRSSTAEIDIVEIFEKYLASKQEEDSDTTNSLFKSQIQQYTAFSQSSVETDRFSGIDLVQS